MKTLVTVLITLLITLTSLAQQGINYKAVLKDTNGNLLAGTFMNVQFTIHESTAIGTIVYQEDHNYTTDANGLLILNIGSDPSPSIGVFSDIDWGSDQLFLQVTINYSGGTINFDATEFMAVPYALNAANVSGIEKITENDGTQDNAGWRLIGVDANNYGPIGEDAVDFSRSSVASTSFGASGRKSMAMGSNTTASGLTSTAMGSNTTASGSVSTALGLNTTASKSGSTAMGSNTAASGNSSTALGANTTASGLVSTAMGASTTASGNRSTAMGDNTIASGNYSIAMGEQSIASGTRSTAMGEGTIASGTTSTTMGLFTMAKSAYETAIGSYNTDYTPNSETSFDENDRLFVIGNGTSSSNRNNALTMFKNGNAEFDGEIQHTSTGTSNMIPIAYGIVESNGDTLADTGNFIAEVSSGVFTIDVNDTESLNYSNTVCVITPISSLARTSSTLIADGNSDGDSDIIVRIFNASGTLAATTFQFVVYRL